MRDRLSDHQTGAASVSVETLGCRLRKGVSMRADYTRPTNPVKSVTTLPYRLNHSRPPRLRATKPATGVYTHAAFLIDG